MSATLKHRLSELDGVYLKMSAWNEVCELPLVQSHKCVNVCEGVQDGTYLEGFKIP